jgi:hypothetical protein
MVNVPVDLIAAGTSEAGSAALEAPTAALDVLAAGAELVVAAGALVAGAAVELFLLAQPLRASIAAIARTPAAWVRVQRRSGVTGPPDTGRVSGDVRPGVAQPHGT